MPLAHWITLPLTALMCALPAAADTLITGARVVDGSGGPTITADVRIEGDRIAEIGRLTPREGDTVIEAKGMVLSPGFIDTHTHHIDAVDWAGEKKFLPDLPDATAAISQGITTSIVGQDGRSYLPLGENMGRLERIGVSLNVASYIGHGTVRLAVMGEDFRRAATPNEIRRMRNLVVEAMADGALGLSTGLEYNPGIFATPEEVLTLAQEAADQGGRYITHIRSEDRDIWPAQDEAIHVGRVTGMPVQLSHIKLGMMDLWGQADRFLAVLDQARADGIKLTADIYPYTFWQTTLTVLFPDRNYKDLEAARYALSHVVPADGIRFIVYRPNPDYVGKTLAEVARLRGEAPEVALINLIVDSPTPEDFELTTMAGMSQQDVDTLIQWPHANICSDGHLIDGHPRGAGAFTKVLRYYVREQKILSLEAAIHKMSGLAAAHMGIRARGLIKPGYFADLVLFDPDTVADRATADDPHAVSVGIAKVWVNGAVVYENGAATAARPGRFLRGNEQSK